MKGPRASASSVPASLLLACLLAACPRAEAEHPQSATPNIRVRLPDQPPALEPEGGAFLLITSDETVVVPVDPARAVVSLRGMWVGSDGPGELVRGHVPVEIEWETEAREGATSVPWCPSFESECVAEEGEFLSMLLESVYGEKPSWTMRHAVGGEACDCVSVVGISDDGEAQEEELSPENLSPEEVSDAEIAGVDLERYIEECLEAGDDHLEDASISGGVLFRWGEYSPVSCTGLNNYSADGREIPLRPGVGAVERWTLDGVTCSGEFESEEFYDSCTYGQPDCCVEAGEALVVEIESGVQVQRHLNLTPVGAYCDCVVERPALQSCPSSFDPCGSGDGFELDGDERWWAFTEGEFALAIRDERAVVLRAGRKAPVRSDPLGINTDQLLGVETHPAFPVTVPELGRFAVVLPEMPEHNGHYSAKAWGNTCFHLFRVGDLDAAEGACVEALRLGGTDNTRGAVTYSLGRIAEARDQPNRALAFYDRSLRLRPGNAAVKSRRAALRSAGG